MRRRRSVSEEIEVGRRKAKKWNHRKRRSNNAPFLPNKPNSRILKLRLCDRSLLRVAFLPSRCNSVSVTSVKDGSPPRPALLRLRLCDRSISKTLRALEKQLRLCDRSPQFGIESCCSETPLRIRDRSGKENECRLNGSAPGNRKAGFDGRLVRIVRAQCGSFFWIVRRRTG